MKEGADINQNNVIGDTALHAACRKGGKDGKIIFDLLLGKGANPFLETRNGRTPYMIFSHIHGSSCFLQAFDLKPELESISDDYDIAK